jgi:hypothetical protein
MVIFAMRMELAINSYSAGLHAAAAVGWMPEAVLYKGNN